MKFNSSTKLKVTGGIIAAALASSVVFASEIVSLPLPGDTLFPESLAIDAMGGIYVSSVMDSMILYVEPDQRSVSDAFPMDEGKLVSVGGLILSQGDKTLYACNSDLGLNDRRGSSKPALLAFDIANKTLSNRWELPGGGMCNDITIGKDGILYVTDSFVPRVLMLKPGAAELVQFIMDERFKGEGFNLSGIAAFEDHLIVAKFNSGELYRIDLKADGSASSPISLKLSQPLFAPDGIKKLGPNTLLVAESGGRLSNITLRGDEAFVEVLQEELRGPNAVAIRENNAYVLEGQLGRLPGFDPEGRSPEPFAIKIIPLK